MLFQSGGLPVGKMVITGVVIALLSSGCAGSPNQQTTKTQSAKQESKQESKQSPASRIRMKTADGSMIHDIRAYTDGQEKVWLPVKETMQSFNFKMHQGKDGGYMIGGTDPLYSIHTGKKEARAGDRVMQLPDAPKQIGGRPHMTADSLSLLLGTKIHWDQRASEVRIHPPARPSRPQTQNADEEPFGRQTLNENEKAQLIDFGKRFLGTPYEFGAQEYEDDRTFDCSSFVRHVYKRFNIDLPRTSIDQSEVGREVDQQDLQVGDLMFFYTPGRYETNGIVGHVGIYAGNNKILHTYGDPGVVVTDFDDYWQERFLFAKRVM